MADMLGFSEVANPIEAYKGYHNDDRVIALLAYGLRNQKMSPLIEDRCEWIELAR